MKILTTALAALALVACSSEPNTTPDTGVDASTETSAEKARLVSLNVAGMT